MCLFVLVNCLLNAFAICVGEVTILSVIVTYCIVVVTKCVTLWLVCVLLLILEIN